ncbi:MAG: hypothetical protein KBG24_12230 [Bacteroidia bacterium]|nr:hypothetical protein [Bacteroidia bacterium]MBP9181252.1 hypothetical protein [Bacteroidia bacterium]
MKKTTLTFLTICLTFLTFGQVSENKKMIELGKTYKDFMFRNEPTKEMLKELKSDVPENLKTATEFIVQTITTKNKLLTQSFLSRPDDKVLKQIYIIRAINLNFREENQIDNNKLIDSLSNKDIPTYELIDNYYGMIFTSVGNKNQPFDLSKSDFKMKEYNFKDDTEKGIMFLRCMDYCGKTIWGFMNIVKPANTSKAYDNIKRFPKFNGQPYYQYTDFYFTDFEMNIAKDKGIQGYKSYYLDKYYETLLSHLTCLNKEGGSEKEQNNILLGSILKESNLYKYTKHKETLEDIFKEQKRE